MTTKQSTHIPTPAMIESASRALAALRRGDWDMGDVGAIEALMEAAREPTPSEDVVERFERELELGMDKGPYVYSHHRVIAALLASLKETTKDNAEGMRGHE
jgi:hypothetical protein